MGDRLRRVDLWSGVLQISKIFQRKCTEVGREITSVVYQEFRLVWEGRCALRIKLCILKYMGKIVLKEERDGDRKDKKATRERMELKSKMDSGGLK